MIPNIRSNDWPMNAFALVYIYDVFVHWYAGAFKRVSQFFGIYFAFML